MSTASEAARIRTELETLADPADAVRLARFFKTGPGGYAEGDRFLGIRAPVLESVARQNRDIDLETLARLLAGCFHEERMLALRVLVNRYRRTSADPTRQELARFYLDHPDGVNNWDLVDISAPWLIGGELTRGRLMDTTRRMAGSPGLWICRQAIVATLGPVRQGRLEPALEICAAVVPDHRDLIQKATGWVLREVGKRDRSALTGFLDRHGSAMGRTALRYSIERLPEALRRSYLLSTRAPAGAR